MGIGIWGVTQTFFAAEPPKGEEAGTKNPPAESPPPAASPGRNWGAQDCMDNRRPLFPLPSDCMENGDPRWKGWRKEHPLFPPAVVEKENPPAPLPVGVDHASGEPVSIPTRGSRWPGWGEDPRRVMLETGALSLLGILAMRLLMRTPEGAALSLALSLQTPEEGM